MLVREVMTAPAVTVAPDTAVGTVARTMIDRGVGAVAVVDSRAVLVGIITESDLLVRQATLHFPTYFGLLDALLPVGGDRNLDDELRRVLAVTAKEAMTHAAHTTGPDEDVGTVAHYMVQHHIHAVPVLEEGRLVGMLFPRDVVRLIAQAAT